MSDLPVGFSFTYRRLLHVHLATVLLLALVVYLGVLRNYPPLIHSHEGTWGLFSICCFLPFTVLTHRSEVTVGPEGLILQRGVWRPEPVAWPCHTIARIVVGQKRDLIDDDIDIPGLDRFARYAVAAETDTGTVICLDAMTWAKANRFGALLARKVTCPLQRLSASQRRHREA
jgi:hypothetical protein